jgi:hypothetical protein
VYETRRVHRTISPAAVRYPFRPAEAQ